MTNSRNTSDKIDLLKDHRELAVNDIEEDPRNDLEDEDEPRPQTARERWLDGVDNGNRDYL